ncbi:putative inner membrane protein [Escherichia coli]|uniref:Putative inner membrane protein n=1 Tax=Escherichia coli TaxID=562 RepID=A0A376VMJ4_ECOLX|nr:putative inner membrane protein [Escherichia coli]
MPQAAVKRGLSEAWRLIIPGWCGRFFAALAAGWLASVSGLSTFWASVIMTVPFSAVVVWQGRFGLLSFIPGGFLGMTLFFASGMNWTGDITGFSGG